MAGVQEGAGKGQPWQAGSSGEDRQDLGTAGLTGSCLSPFASVLCFGFFLLFFPRCRVTAEEPKAGGTWSCWAAGLPTNSVCQPARSVTPLAPSSCFEVSVHWPSLLGPSLKVFG